jgi:flagellar biosynthesis protein FlhF
MRLLRFRAATLSEAMAQVRRDLGPEAMILSTRRTDGLVELTAATEEHDGPEPARLPLPPMPGRPGAASRRAAPGNGPGSGPGNGPAAARLAAGGTADPDRAQVLTWHGVPSPLAGRLCAGPLPFALSLALRFAPLPLQAAAAGPQRPLLLIGPPGAGKTLTAARLATRLVLSGVRPVVVSTDVRRAGASEQLAALTRVLGLELRLADSPASLAHALANRPSSGPAIIDTAGLDPYDDADIAQARALASSAGAEPVAVLPAGGDPAETADMAGSLAAAGANCVVATRLDLARRLGGVVAAASVLALAEFGVAARVADGLIAASPAALARRLTLPDMESVR